MGPVDHATGPALFLRKARPEPPAERFYRRTSPRSQAKKSLIMRLRSAWAFARAVRAAGFVVASNMAVLLMRSGLDQCIFLAFNITLARILHKRDFPMLQLSCT
jgi:uncharacterized protein (DUF934 family)